jgi:zinc/manganese transport system substrate-binding protein
MSWREVLAGSEPLPAGSGSTGRPPRRHRPACLGLAAAGVSLLAACGGGGATKAGSSTGANQGRIVQVAAAENFWGSIAAQIGGVHAHVVSVITNPNTDPHAYEPTAGDARTLAESQLVIENGIGYDPWAAKLLAADGGSGTTLDVGSVLGLAAGANPHRWYNPGDVQRVIKKMVTDYQRLDPTDGGYFAQQEVRFDAVDLKQYDATVASIRNRYSGTPVGASESIFALLAPALGLDLITPPSFLKAISEGTDVSVADKETVDRQIQEHRIKVYVYNSQNVTPDVQAQLNEVKAEHIPVATITETLQPAATTYQAWQTRQLEGIEAALARAQG